MANENLGDIKCPLCELAAHVRRYSARKPPVDGVNRGKFYIHCGDCGPILTSGAKAQEYILNKGKLYGANKPADDVAPSKPATPAPKPAAVAAAAKPAAAASAAPAKKPSIWDDL